jgi:hypothetical protein
MKKTIFLLLLSVYAGLGVVVAEETASDTTILFNNKIIHIQDNANEVNVKVSEVDAINDTVPYKQLYEGIYSDSKSYEKWTVVEDLGIQIPLLTSRKVKERQKHKMESHWAGFGYSYSTITDGHNNYTDVNGMALELGESHDWTYNAIEHITPLFFNYIGLTTGLGMTWRNYYLEDGTYLAKVDGEVGIYDGASDCNYKYSKLRTVYLTIPALLELQLFKASKKGPYLAVGVVGGIKTLSSFKVKYTNALGETVRSKERDMNIPPLTLDYVAQAGVGRFSVYAQYSPFSIFQKGKGPDVRHASIGLMIDL